MLAGLGTVLVGSVAGCRSSGSNSQGSDAGAGDSTSSSGSGGSGSSGSGSSGGSSSECPSGLTCNVSCSGGGTTSITGTVYDPAGRDPLYNIEVYVPAKSLVPLPQGVPTGSAACSCPALYPSGEVAATSTAVDGTFRLTNAPVGDVSLVIQVGKWRRLFHVTTTACENTAVPDGTLLLPSTVAAGDTDDSIPQIAVSTGAEDTLECLLIRMGLSASEYVAGAGGTGHVHIFAGGYTGDGGFVDNVGLPETPGMAGAPPSYSNLWDSQGEMMPYDVVLLSCEGGETYDANPPALEAYLNAGGRVFASHLHYAWFSGPLSSGQAYAAPADWGTNLATWTADGGSFAGPIGGTIATTLNGSAFAEGQALYEWLGGVTALGQDGVSSPELSIYEPRYNAQVGPTNKPSQPWITSSPWTMSFSFDTPIGGLTDAGESGPLYCGRAAFGDLHTSGNPMTTDTPDPPGGCYTGDLSPQEKALEFLFFNLSGCVQLPVQNLLIDPPL